MILSGLLHYFILLLYIGSIGLVGAGTIFLLIGQDKRRVIGLFAASVILAVLGVAISG